MIYFTGPFPFCSFHRPCCLAKYHSFHVYFQIQEWKDNASEMQLTAWAWKDCDGKLMSVLTNLPPAPDELLKIITCNCHTDCNSMRCTSKKYNMKCFSACGNCKGTGYTNLDISIHEEDNPDTYILTLNDSNYSYTIYLYSILILLI